MSNRKKKITKCKNNSHNQIESDIKIKLKLKISMKKYKILKKYIKIHIFQNKPNQIFNLSEGKIDY